MTKTTRERIISILKRSPASASDIEDELKRYGLAPGTVRQTLYRMRRAGLAERTARLPEEGGQLWRLEG